MSKHLDLKGKRILDVGCGNGYYMWRMLGAGADSVIGVDPNWLFFCQFQAAVTFFHFLVELRLQGVGPFGQRSAGQTAGEWGQINHGKAINEAKLRHWNHGTTFENPAASRRSRCSSRLSGFMTFSMALRFWAISSSL